MIATKRHSLSRKTSSRFARYFCGKCNSSGAYGEKILICSRCYSYFCWTCASVCSECGKDSCPDCVSHCKLCNSTIDPNCLNQQCKECGSQICSQCLDHCKICDTLVCNDCLNDKGLCSKCQDVNDLSEQEDATREEPIFTSLSQFNDAIAQVLNINCENRVKLMGIIYRDLPRAIRQWKIPYYCDKCHSYHRKGKKYNVHYKTERIFPQIKKIHQFDTQETLKNEIVGLHYHGTEDYVSSLDRGTNLILKKEPENPSDRYTISVWHGEKMLGHIGKWANKSLFLAMEKKEVSCQILGYHSAHFKSVKYYKTNYDDGYPQRETHYGQKLASPSRADIEITLYEPEFMKSILQNLIEMEKLLPNYPALEKQIAEHLSSLGRFAQPYLQLLSCSEDAEFCGKYLPLVMKEMALDIDSGYKIIL